MWHITGYMFPINTFGLADTFFTKGMFCWGWATWERAWKHFMRDPENLPSRFSEEMVRDFNYDGTNRFFDQLLANKSGKLHTWAIYWYATIYLNKALCLSPRDPIVKNIGHDGSGIHCGRSILFESEPSNIYPVFFENNIEESQQAKNRLIHFFKSLNPSFAKKIINKIARMGKSTVAKNILKKRT